jgi:predicted RNase H-like HicB family nuclease/DNA-binding XRE family transcriptional regulator
VTYHFRIHRRGRLWAECIELEGCVTQGRNRAELQANMREALNRYLEEPASSRVVFPPPAAIRHSVNVVTVEVDPGVAFAVQLRQFRIRSRLTQKEAARRLHMQNVDSYQRLERRSNPSLSTLMRVKKMFPDFSLDRVFGE